MYYCNLLPKIIFKETSATNRRQTLSIERLLILSREFTLEIIIYIWFFEPLVNHLSAVEFGQPQLFLNKSHILLFEHQLLLTLQRISYNHGISLFETTHTPVLLKSLISRKSVVEQLVADWSWKSSKVSAR